VVVADEAKMPLTLVLIESVVEDVAIALCLIWPMY
jgi:hypothetical protein